jgi:hypothetical protein
MELAQRENGSARITYCFAVIRPEKGFVVFMQQIPFLFKNINLKTIKS